MHKSALSYATERTVKKKKKGSLRKGERPFQLLGNVPVFACFFKVQEAMTCHFPKLADQQ